MRNVIIGLLLLYTIIGCINAELKTESGETKYSLKLLPESKDLVLTALPGDNVRFTLMVEGVAPLKGMMFYAGEKFIDIAGTQNRTPPYQIEITGFIIDKNSSEETLLCKVVAETNEGMFVTSNIVVVKVIDMNSPQIVKFEKDQTPSDSIVSDSPFSVIVETQDLNTGISRIELYDANNLLTTKIDESVSGKYVNKRYNFVAPLMNCGVVQLVLRVYDDSSQKNFAEKRLLLKINGHPFDENAPDISFISPEQKSSVSIGENITIRVRGEDDCSLVDKIYYYTSFDEQVYTVNVVNKKRVVEEDIVFRVPDSLRDQEEFSVYVWAEDTNDPKHGSRDNAAELKLVASGRDVPQVVIISPQDNVSVAAGDKVVVSGTAISKRYQIKEVALRITGSYSETRKIQLNPAQATATFSFDVNIPANLKAGDQILIYVDAKDNSSAESTGSAGPVRVNIINQKPQVQILSPSEDDIFYPSSNIGTTVFAQSSNVSIKSVSYHIEGIEGITVDETFTLPVPQKSVSKIFSYKLPDDVPEGNLYITASATDTSENQGKSGSTRIMVVDNVKPLASVVSPAYNSLVDAGSVVELVVRAEDKNSLVAEIDANVISPYNDQKKMIINKKSDEVTFSFSIPDTLMSNQIITIQVFALDDSSLSNKSEVVQWRLRVH